MSDHASKVTFVQGMRRYVRRQEDWARARSSVLSKSVYGHGGASMGVTWEGEEAAMVAYLEGARSPVVDPAHRLRFEQAVVDLGLHITHRDPNSDDTYFPFNAHAIDKDSSTWTNERFFATFGPTGELYALQDSKFQLDLKTEDHLDKTAEQFLNLALFAMRTAWLREQQYRRRFLQEKNEMRRERNLPEFTCYAHAAEPTAWEARNKRKAA